jgi:hypothetical protein
MPQGKAAAPKLVSSCNNLPNPSDRVDIWPIRGNGRCQRCHRSIQIRYPGQIFGPVCLKRIKDEELDNSPIPQSLSNESCVATGLNKIDGCDCYEAHPEVKI